MNRLSVLIVGAGDTRALLDRLANQSLGSASYEVLRVGESSSLADAVRSASGEVVLFAHPDTRPGREWLAAHLDAQARAPRLCSVRGANGGDLDGEGLHSWPTFSAVNHSVRREELARVLGEDTSFHEAGYRLFLEGWRVWHAPECDLEGATSVQLDGPALARLEEAYGEDLLGAPHLEARASDQEVSAAFERLDLAALEGAGDEGARLAAHCRGLLEGEEGPLEPWPLATESSRRFLAWPKYEDGSLDPMLSEWAPNLPAGACLCLRHDERFDGSLEAATQSLQAAWERSAPSDLDLEVLIVDGELGLEDLPRLGAAIEAYLDLAPDEDPARFAFKTALAAAVVTAPV